MISETVPPGQPVGVSSQALVDSAVVSWSAPEEGVLVRGYVIGYGEGVPDVNWQYLEAHRRNVTIRNLSELRTGSSCVFLPTLPFLKNRRKQRPAFKSLR